MVKHLLIPTTTYYCCVNDCQIYRFEHSEDIECAVCDEDRYLTNSQNPRKAFTYMPLSPRLASCIWQAVTCVKSGSIKRMPTCRETGEYCKNLHKVVHLNNRLFLPTNHHLQSGRTNYASKREESSTTQHMYINEKDYDLRKQYDDLSNKNQKNNMQKRTGLKDTYHNRSEQM
ncbi:unnamed protein product [Mytilus coruscus]|uniref:Uncharacterized protein n=1 Tax=Mytilus coruscus TaxID=42192 RepID=A0A6J8DF19_MYTCO|nr:unnamed protein product [Mytilus coruscus]